MLHDDVHAVITQAVLSNGQLLQAHIVLEHLAEVDGHGLADGLVDGVLNVKLFEGIVR